MTEKRFTNVVIEEIENQSFRDNFTEKTYWIDNGLDEIVELLNELYEENEQLKEKLADTNELNRIYVDFLVDKGFELFDVMEWLKKELKE